MYKRQVHTLNLLIALALLLSISTQFTPAHGSIISSSSETTSSTGLVAYYSLDNDSANDSSGNGNHGTIYGSPQIVSGRRGQALRFGGYYHPDYIVVPNSSSLSFADNFTFSVWFNILSNTSQDGVGYVSEYGVQAPIAKSGDRSGISLYASRSVQDGLWYPFVCNGRCCGSGSVAIHTQTGMGAKLNEWHMGSITHGNGMVRFYLDGALQDEMTATAFGLNPAMANRPVYIGDSLAGTYSHELWFPFNGILDEIRIYNRALSATDIQELYQQDGTPYISGLVKNDRGTPMPGVTVSADSSLHVVTNASGYYKIGDIITGTYTITPTLVSYRFAPITRTVTVPPSKTEQNFIIRPVTPTLLLDLPFDYGGTVTAFVQAVQGNVGGSNSGRVNSWFDHATPNYESNDVLKLWTGTVLTQTDSGTSNCRTQTGAFIPGCTNVRLSNCNKPPGGFGLSCYDGHNGIDFQRSVTNEPIYAAATGVVTEVHRTWPTAYGARGAKYGNYVLIDHGGGYATFYAHLALVNDNIDIGTEITNTQVISLGVMGGTGGWPVHLHFGLYYDQSGDHRWAKDEVVDPYGWSPVSGQPDPWNIKSFYLWKYPLNSQQPAGNAGANMKSPSGNVTIAVPPGALSSTVTLDLWDAPPVAGPSAQLRSTGHSFWFHVLEWLSAGSADELASGASTGFAQPVTVTVTYSDTETLHLNESQLTIYRWIEDDNAWVALPTTVDVAQNKAVAQTTEVGNFNLQAPLLCPADIQEPNDNYYAASLLTPNSAPEGQLFDIDQDEDWFRLETIAGAEYTIRTSDLSAGVDTVVQLYDQDGITILASDDNSGGGAASLLVWQAPLSGTYFVRVAPIPGSTYGCSAGYSISATQKLHLYLPRILKNVAY